MSGSNRLEYNGENGFLNRVSDDSRNLKPDSPQVIQFGEGYHVANLFLVVYAGGHAGASGGAGGCRETPPFLFVGSYFCRGVRNCEFEQDRDCVSFYVFANKTLSLASSHSFCINKPNSFS